MDANNRKILFELSTSAFGIALKEYLKEEKAGIQDIKTITTLEELQGRQHALKVIDKLFSFLEERKEQSGGKNQYS